MRVLNVLATGNVGGLEVLVKNIVLNSEIENYCAFLFSRGPIYDELKCKKKNTVSCFDDSNSIFRKIDDIIKYINSNNIDVVNFHDGGLKSLIILYFLQLRCKNISFVRTFHDSPTDSIKYSTRSLFKKYLRLSIIKLTSKRCKKNICVSKSVESSVCSLNIKNTYVLYNGIPKSFINSSFSKKNYKYDIVFVGRLSKVKGLSILINAIEILKNKGKRIKCVIVGDGIEKNNLINIIEHKELVDYFEFVGAQKNVAEYLDHSKLFVYPSIWKEAFGISVVEAMARKCIPIVSNVGGLGEIVSNNEDGFLFERNNEQQLSDIIEMLLNYEETNLEAIKEKTVKKAKHFTLDKTVKNLNELYFSLDN